MKIITSLLLLLLSTGLFAQVNNQRQNTNRQNTNRQNQINNRNRPNFIRTPSLSIGIVVMEPQGAFDRNYDGIPAGINGQFMINMGNAPIDFGGGFAWFSRGGTSSDIDIYEGTDADGDDYYVEGTMDVNSNIYAYDAIARFRPFNGIIQPYGDAIAGFQTYSTKTKITAIDGNTEDIVDRAHRDFAVSFGWAAGLKVKISPSIAVEGRFSNIIGSEVKFVDRESVEINADGDLFFDQKNSSTSHYLYQVGVSFTL